MTDYVATRTGNRVRVKLSTGWTITYEDGAEQAQISAPGFQHATGAMSPPKSARSRAVVTVESLADGLVERIRTWEIERKGQPWDWEQ